MLASLPLLAGCDGRPAAPRFQYLRLDGTRADSARLRGKVVLLNFWATTCATCVREMPRLVELHEKFRAHGLETLAVAMGGETPERVTRFAESRRLPFTVAIDDTGTIAGGFGGIPTTPTAILIDREGGIVKRYVGEPDFVDLQATVRSLLAGG